MKKVVCMLLALVMMSSVALAAEIEINGGEKRNITINKAEPNEMTPGVSPTTGRNLNELNDEYYQDGFAGYALTGRYMPILVQIDNADGGIGYDDGKETYNRAPWGVEYTDVIYEAALYKAGNTRLTFLFSDIIPNEVGPLRSARWFHAYLREEWDCAFIYYGQQAYGKTNVPALFDEFGATNKGVLFSGIVGMNKPWKKYFGTYEKKKLQSPHNRTVDAAAVVSLVPPDFEAAEHAWLFADDLPDESVGDAASVIYVNWGTKDLQMYNSILEWNEDDENYVRYMVDNKGKEHIYQNMEVKKGSDVIVEAKPVTFNNIIVQFVEDEWPRSDAPKPTVVGSGNADYFMGGRHIAGVWNRESASDRTVFYDDKGNEIELQPGRTLVVLMDYAQENRSVAYEAD